VGSNLIDHPATPGLELALAPEARLASTRLPVLASVVRYSSGLAGAGPNDMQMVWFNAVGATAEGLAGDA
jgi:5-(hydroxymethyl)furfural/furfural oxidase